MTGERLIYRHINPFEWVERFLTESYEGKNKMCGSRDLSILMILNEHGYSYLLAKLNLSSVTVWVINH